jgi:ABC-type antimicrobial peptide transport system permease subunit
MNFKAYSIILTRQIKQKFGRFLLASGGIAVGVWAITFTNGLSTGAQNTLQDFVNGQPIAREFQVNKTAQKVTNLFSADSPSFLPLNNSDVTTILNNNPDIDFLTVRSNIKLNVIDSAKPANLESCEIKNSTTETERLIINAGKIDRRDSASGTTPEEVKLKEEKEKVEKDKLKTCKTISVSRSNPKSLYINNRTNWVGSKPEELKENEIIICFKCGVNLFETVDGVTKPEELLNKKVTVNLIEAPSLYPVGQAIKFTQNNLRSVKTSQTNIFTPNTQEYTIKAVIDDSQTSTISINDLGSSTAYFPEKEFLKAFDLANPGIDSNLYGAITIEGAVKTYDKLESTLTNLNKDYLTFSLGALLVQSIPQVFGAVNALFLIFGLIAVIASIFGIVNVMAISVLERKKEIGILKALGAKDGSIFLLFFSESVFLGFLGWFIGTLIAVGMGYGLSAVLKAVLNSNNELRKSLETFNLTNFNPAFATSLLFTTLAIALVCTVLAGLVPSLRAARQNPAEVMRSE